MSDRIRKIRELLRESPDDLMLNYSLGMEYASAGMHDDAVACFQVCIGLDDQYLPAHVEAAKALRSAGKLQAAREAFAEAMELAARKGESHVRDFLQQQLDGLPK